MTRQRASLAMLGIFLLFPVDGKDMQKRGGVWFEFGAWARFKKSDHLISP